MKRTFVLFSILLAFVSSAFADVERPDINVGTTWTVQKADLYTNSVVDSWRAVVEGKTDAGYDIGKYTIDGKLISRYKITKNLGQGSPNKAGNIGDGNLYPFPLKVGDTWTTRAYWDNAASGSSGYDDITFTIVGEEVKTVKAGVFTVLKIVGKGFWQNTSKNFGGSLEQTSYYAPKAFGAIWSERVNHAPRGGASDRNVYELIDFEAK
jgi:hypothetical protein